MKRHFQKIEVMKEVENDLTKIINFLNFQLTLAVGCIA